MVYESLKNIKGIIGNSQLGNNHLHTKNKKNIVFQKVKKSLLPLTPSCVKEKKEIQNEWCLRDTSNTLSFTRESFKGYFWIFVKKKLYPLRCSRLGGCCGSESSLQVSNSDVAGSFLLLRTLFGTSIVSFSLY